jgi:uncharacterized membrane protein YhaH (DUF805 family)
VHVVERNARGIVISGTKAIVTGAPYMHELLVMPCRNMGPEDADFAVNLVLLWPIIAVMAKRWHDRDRSGWWVLVLLLPVVGWIWALVVNGCLRGTVGPNPHGPDPLSHQ